MPVFQNCALHFWPNGALRSYAKSADDFHLASFEHKELEDIQNTAIYLDGSQRATSSRESRDEEKQAVL